MDKKKSAENYVSTHPRWSEELKALRKIALSTGLDETVKWGIPTYTWNGQNIAGIAGFKSYFGIWFYQGALLKDKNNKLINAQENKTKALRQWRFNSMEEIEPALLKSYLMEAIENEKAGKKIKPARSTSFQLPMELKNALTNNKTLEEEFKSLTPGRQKEYAEFISEPKKEETRIRRLEKSIPIILSGKGLNDKYK